MLRSVLQKKTQKFALIFLTTYTLSACVPEINLEYPEPKQDFASLRDEPELRSDATLAQLDPQDFELDMELELDLLPPDQGPLQPVLRTRSLEFTGEIQSTYNDVEPRIIGHYSWLIPIEPSSKNIVNQQATPNAKLNEEKSYADSEQ